MKRLLALPFALLACLAFTGCGPSDSSPNNSAAPGEKQQDDAERRDRRHQPAEQANEDRAPQSGLAEQRLPMVEGQDMATQGRHDSERRREHTGEAEQDRPGQQRYRQYGCGAQHVRLCPDAEAAAQRAV